MFQVEVLAAKPALADIPAVMPLNVLLGLPEYVTEFPTTPFNLPAAINDLMGRAGWERATKVLKPLVWAPGWDDEQLRQFITAPFGKKGRDFPEEGLKELRISTPDTPFSPLKPEPRFAWQRQRYDIIHLLARLHRIYSFTGFYPIENYRYALEPFLDLGQEPGTLMAGTLRDMLILSRTRLLILQVAADEEALAQPLARQIVEMGGPAVLVVAGGEPASLESYFLNLYASIVHNQRLSEVVRPQADESGRMADDLSLHLFMGSESEDLLRFEWFAEIVYSRINRCHRIIRRTPIFSKLHEVRALIPRSQVHNYRIPIAAFENIAYISRDEPVRRAEVATVLGAAFDLSRDVTSMQRELDWSHESGAALPVSEAAEAIPELEGSTENIRYILEHIATSYPEIGLEIQRALDEMARHAPRVLNANFADPQTRSLITPNEALLAEQAYDLLVDVGPRWNSIPSIVRGNSEFPEQALPPDQDGYLIKVVLISSDFQTDAAGDALSGADDEPPDHPNEPATSSYDPVDIEFDPSEFDSEESVPGSRPCLATAWMWIPRNTGRSYPYIKGARNDWQGPVRLRLRTPKFPENSRERHMTARGRLCLYYENNLLQSAVIRMSIAKSAEDRVLIEANENEIEVDFVLSGTFQELDRFARREMRTGAEKTASYPVALNLTMNDDGGGGHRIIVERGKDRLTRWIPYNTADARRMLEKTRALLLDCFWLKDRTSCKVDAQQRQNALGSNGVRNGKTYRQFQCDLAKLAVQGNLLYNRVFVQAAADSSGKRALDWENDLRLALAKTSLIQVPRTGSANYAYPWALLYDIPLPDYKTGGLRWCAVLEEEWSNPEALRNQPIQEYCPHQDEPEHRSNTLCPYGFWGLKHHIEQPINPISQSEETAGDLMQRKVLEEIYIDHALNLSVGITRDQLLNSAAIRDHLNALQHAAAYVPMGGADDKTKVFKVLESSDLAYFLCHGMYDSKAQEPYLGVGPNDNDDEHRIYPNDLLNWARPFQGKLWENRHPLVFINGCHTSDLKPDEVLNFVSTFGVFGASGVIGTEVSVQLPLAIEIAEGLLSRLIQGISVSHALHEVRWELVNKGNLLGLVYTPYCMTNLHIARPPQSPGPIAEP